MIFSHQISLKTWKGLTSQLERTNWGSKATTMNFDSQWTIQDARIWRYQWIYTIYVQTSYTSPQALGSGPRQLSALSTFLVFTLKTEMIQFQWHTSKKFMPANQKLQANVRCKKYQLHWRQQQSYDLFIEKRLLQKCAPYDKIHANQKPINFEKNSNLRNFICYLHRLKRTIVLSKIKFQQNW